MSKIYEDNLGFWDDKCIVISKLSWYDISLFSIMNGHMFQ